MKILVTGGAGFIGSNLVEALLKLRYVTYVRVLDNLSSGYYKNIEPFLSNPKFEFVKGDIQDINTCMEACNSMDLIAHQAAMVSVPKSIENPFENHNVNINGTLNLLLAAKANKIRRLVFATSSAVYGDNKNLPLSETEAANFLSPYSLSKYVNELYASLFANLYGISFIGLRYFNVYGQRQNPCSDYASFIPKLIKAALDETTPTIKGDGTFSSDYVHIQDVIQANILSLFSQNYHARNKIFNIGRGEETTLNQLWSYIKESSNCSVDAIHDLEEKVEAKRSLADIAKASTLLGYTPKVPIHVGISKTISYYKEAVLV